MKPLLPKGEKPYRITARDYGNPIRRACCVVAHSLAKGFAIGVVVSFIFVNSKLSFSGWLLLLVPLTVFFGVWAAISDRSLYVGEIEIQPDRLIRFSGGASVAIEKSEVRSVREGRRWTMFGPVSVLTVKGKNATVFIPIACPDYEVMKSGLTAWCEGPA